jgi:DNA polymerase, archaea type
MKFQTIPFHENQVLFGHDPTPRIVAVEFDGEKGMEVFFREGSMIRAETQPFRPFLFLESTSHLQGWKGTCEIRDLEGEEPYRHLVFVPTWKELGDLVKFFAKVTGSSPGSFDAPFYYLNDPVHQHLLLTGQTLFKSMSFDDLVRLQLDIETYCAEEFEFSNPLRPEDRIIVISVSDNRGWERVISGKDLDEKAMLEELVGEITSRDPDVIEGHNLFNFDLDYIQIRAKHHKIPLALGRKARLLGSHPSRLQIAERTVTYRKFEAYGRHIVDTWLLSQMYDVVSRDLESYGLKDVARHFHVNRPDRTYINPERVNWYFENDPETLIAYALDDVRETRAVSEILSRSFFYQTQIFPYSFQNTVVRGNATKIDALLLREYLRAGHSIPKPPTVKEFPGGYTDIFYQGVIHRVLYCDIQSLYPSIMLAFRYYPQRDTLSIFPSLLSDLKAFRIQAKDMKKNAATREEAAYFEALQSTFKILINSFYGYLGFPYGHFSDPDSAEKVTAAGREMIKGMVGWLKENGCRPIEIDTDGIYFVPPENLSEKEEEALVGGLSQTLPAGITLELAGRFQAMFSYKIKNYALLGDQAQVIVKGSGLRSRGLELFQRRFMKETIALLLKGRGEEVENLLSQYLDDLLHHRWDRKMFIKTETLQESPSVYQEKVKAKKRNPSAAYELALKSGRNFQAGDQLSYYITRTDKKMRAFEACKLASEWDPKNPDENLEHYKEKLLGLYEKFRPFIKKSDTSALPPLC